MTERGLSGAGLSLACNVQTFMSNSDSKPTKLLWEIKPEGRVGDGVQGDALMGACLSIKQLVADFPGTES